MDTVRPRVLVEAGFGIGDVIEATPACHALWLLGFDVDFLISRPDAAGLAPLFDGHPVFGRVLSSRRDVVPGDYDFGVACHGGGPMVYAMPLGRCFWTTASDIARLGLVEANLAAARALGFEGSVPPHPIRTFGGASLPDSNTIVVHAGCNPDAGFKRWPHWETVCRRLRESGHSVLIVGTEFDVSASGWERQHNHRFNLSLTDLASVLHDAHVYLGNDSGVSHLAGAVGARGLVLFGPTSAWHHAPASDTIRVLQAPARSGESYHPFSARFPSFDRLELDAVFAAVQEVVTARPVRREVRLPRRPEHPNLPAVPFPTVVELLRSQWSRAHTDQLLQRTVAASVVGGLTRRSQGSGADGWTQSVALRLLHMKAAAVNVSWRQRLLRKKARFHLRNAGVPGPGRMLASARDFSLRRSR